ncbi:hypothetical protein BSPWISOXPB_556 [uncultured Gammaproteobacteria bacterium]|nr:hypothetical protein BSPWISOXPB_556 [uncultured Gammaproteobacteria bacterium]
MIRLIQAAIIACLDINSFGLNVKLFIVFRFGARAFVVVLFGAVVVLFRVLRFVLAMVGVIARVVIRVKIDITNGFGIWLF